MSWFLHRSPRVRPPFRRSLSSNRLRLGSARTLNTLSSSATIRLQYATFWLHVKRDFKKSCGVMGDDFFIRKSGTDRFFGAAATATRTTRLPATPRLVLPLGERAGVSTDFY